jgi:hypothetical protein
MSKRVGVANPIRERHCLLTPGDRLLGVVALQRETGHLRVRACQLDSRGQLFEDFGGIACVDPRVVRRRIPPSKATAPAESIGRIYGLQCIRAYSPTDDKAGDVKSISG